MGRIIALFVLLGSGLAQVGSPSGRQVYVDVRVNKDVSPVDPVTPLYFQVKLHGQPVGVSAADRKSVQPRVAIVLDTSGSMTFSEAMWGQAFQLTDKTIRALDGIAEISLTLSGDKLTKVFSSRDGTLVMLQKLQEFHVGKDPRIGHGRTQLRDAISTAVNIGHLQSGDAVIVISDGGENSSHTTQDEIEKKLRFSGVRLYGILFVKPIPETPEEKMGPSQFQDFAESTGGFSVPIDKGTVQELTKAVDIVTNSITKPCVLQLDVPDDASGKLSVAYRDESGKLNRGLTVFAPKYLFAIKSDQNAAPAK